MSEKEMRFRMDFVQEVVSIDEEKGIFTLRIIPDPRRYEWKEKDGKRYLYDRLDKAIISENVLQEAWSTIKEKPIYFQPQKISNAEQYVKERIPFIQERIKASKTDVVLKDKSEEFLENLAKDKLGFAIMCVDIAGSTKLSTDLEPARYVKLISTTLYEMSEVIPKFHGYVLKYTGDGLIAYFPEPSFITKNDLALDCALTIRRLVYDGLNQVFEQNSYPRINIRIGLDSGDAYVLTVGSPEAKSQKDIIGSIVSLSAKIQNLGNSGDVLLGEVTQRNLHTMWREICEEIELGNDWKYKGSSGEPYKVYKVKFR